MAGIAYSEDREDMISYPDSEMLNETFYIYKDESDSSIQCGDITSYSGKRIGALENDQRMIASLEKWKLMNRKINIIQKQRSVFFCQNRNRINSLQKLSVQQIRLL